MPARAWGFKSPLRHCRSGTQPGPESLINEELAAAPDGKGYWQVTSDGGIFSLGDAQFFSSTGALHPNAPIMGMAPMPDSTGYRLVPSDGGDGVCDRTLALPLPRPFGFVPCYPGISAMRFCISSGETSSTWVAMLQRWPQGSSNSPPRSP